MIEARIARLDSQYNELGKRFDEAVKAYKSMLQSAGVSAHFKSIANRSGTFKHELNEIRQGPVLGKLVEMENEMRRLTQAVDSLRRSIGLPEIIDTQLHFIGQNQRRGGAA